MTEPSAEQPERINVAFTDEESACVHQLAGWFARVCEAQGMKPPPDPMRCLLVASFVLWNRVQFLEQILAGEGIDPRDHLPPPGPVQ